MTDGSNVTEFQFTHPRGVRLASLFCWLGYVALFQSTHPRGVRRHTHGYRKVTRWFQSTHPRGVRRRLLEKMTPGGKVSIHAPAWGATAQNPVSDVETYWFQSTHPRGVRHQDAHMPHDAAPVSIHAPAWGATSAQKLGSSSPALFQSTHPRGVRLQGMQICRGVKGFQSTHPRGVRRIPRCRPPFRRCGFNPRTRVGCDFFRVKPPLLPTGFQSTHPRGVRLLDFTHNALCQTVSIHAPAWGATSTTPISSDLTR